MVTSAKSSKISVLLFHNLFSHLSNLLLNNPLKQSFSSFKVTKEFHIKPLILWMGLMRNKLDKKKTFLHTKLDQTKSSRKWKNSSYLYLPRELNWFLDFDGWLWERWGLVDGNWNLKNNINMLVFQWSEGLMWDLCALLLQSYCNCLLCKKVTLQVFLEFLSISLWFYRVFSSYDQCMLCPLQSLNHTNRLQDMLAMNWILRLYDKRLRIG
jgi:hypothetical protein